MQNIFLNSSKLLLLSKELPSRTLQTVSVRYLRKPKWLSGSGVRFNKALRDIEMNIQTVDEFQDQDYHEPSLFNEPNSCKTYCKSVGLCQRELEAKDDPYHQLSLTFDEENSEDMELKRIVHDNEEVNIRVKSIRDKKLVEEWVQIKKEIEGIRKNRENDDAKRLKAATKQVLVDMERLKSSINLEDLDEAIEKAMSSEIDYNFAIDSSGNLIRGRSNNRPDVN